MFSVMAALSFNTGWLEPGSAAPVSPPKMIDGSITINSTGSMSKTRSAATIFIR